MYINFVVIYIIYLILENIGKLWLLVILMNGNFKDFIFKSVFNKYNNYVIMLKFFY